jgi:ABC-type dipeptide/oligopeptide/nickel transport system permease subunit
VGLYVKLALVVGVPYGVIIGLTSGPVDSVASFLLTTLVYGAPVGILVALIIGTLHRRAMRKRGLDGQGSR